jgi:glycosyltransferase involved in cell wall biosynthesis
MSTIDTDTRQPTVSIVTPSLNQAGFLEETILSVLTQDYPNIEYLVMDGGSTDGSIGIIRKYAERLSFWASEPDCGQAQAINRGWRRATGDIVAWLNSDDLYTPGTVSIAVSALQRMPDVDLVYTDCIDLDSTHGTSRRRKARQQDVVSLLLDGVHIPQPTVFLRRTLLDRIGLLDESLQLTMDYHLWLRAACYGRIRYLPDACLAIVRLHPDAKSHARFLQFPEELVRALDRFYTLPDLPREARHVRKRAYANCYYARADIAFAVHQDYLESLRWLAHASFLHPSILARLPGALARISMGRHAPPRPDVIG